jgi:predicted nucleic acid-binding protein
LRLVFDTNIIISALLFDGSKPSKAFDIGINQGALLFSLPTLAELEEVLWRNKFDGYLSRRTKAVSNQLDSSLHTY